MDKKKEGTHTLINKDGVVTKIYTGSFNDAEEYHGYGEIHEVGKGSKFRGPFVNGLKSGKGELS